MLPAVGKGPLELKGTGQWMCGTKSPLLGSLEGLGLPGNERGQRVGTRVPHGGGVPPEGIVHLEGTGPCQH